MTKLVAEISNLVKTYNMPMSKRCVNAVQDVSFRIEAGEVFGLLGPNGSGKTTTMKVMLGLLFPTAGSVSVMGESPRSVKAKERIGYLPEESYLYRFLNATETLEFYGKLFGIPRKERRRRADMLLERVGLTDAKHRPLSDYSKGMARRIGLAQSLINDPDFILLDEPTSGMDPLGRIEMKTIIRELRDEGKSVLLCSHLLAEVEDVCDRVCILYNGKILKEGAVSELLEDTTSRQLNFDTLSNEDSAALLSFLKERGIDKSVIHSKTDRLEDLFLHVIEEANKAHKESAQ